MEEKGKCCLTCMHEALPQGIDPCNKCLCHDEWKPKDAEPVAGIDPGAPVGDKTNVRLDWGERGTELIGPTLAELLFDYTRKALNEFKIAQAEADGCKGQPDAWKYRAEQEIKRQRFSALWDVIEAAGLAEEYEKWTSQPETLPY